MATRVLLAVLLVSLLPASLSEDFYELLGVSRDADNRDIRKAFKKLAVTMHPDKNPEDEGAHERFVRLARAYETLKDPDLRKRYDLHGEEGAERGHHYRSWSFYHDNFGIYDDDPEIITLAGADFEQSVTRGGEAWFVNFYSAMCSHCHELAPAWRRVARRLQGVVRVAAVNCEEDWVLCRGEGVQSYPSIVYYPSRERYRGERSEDDLVEYVLERVTARVHEVTAWPAGDTSLPRLVFFSDQSDDGPAPETRLKLAAMLEGLVWVGHLDCERRANTCEQLGASSGTALWRDAGPSFLPGLEAKELLTQVLTLLPEPTVLDGADFEEMLEALEVAGSAPWLLYFHLGADESSRLELRQLPARLPGLRLGRVNCARSRALCEQLHIQRFPVYAVFKPGGSYEMHHGRSSTSDVVHFARESASSPHVTTLTPLQFSGQGPVAEGPLLVDFFAPWCPPCLRLLPELRRASQQFGPGVPVGTVDCTVHGALCRALGVSSYPTTRLYNGSRVEHFAGEHTAQSILDFLEDMTNPLVRELSDENFGGSVGSKREDEIWLVEYFAPWCRPCQQLQPHWRKLAKMLQDIPMLHVGAVNCESHAHLCQEQGVRSYPTIRIYPTGSRGTSQVSYYSGMQRDAHSLRQWVMNFVPSLVTSLSEGEFLSEVLGGGGQPWVVDFYAPWCGHCHVFAPEFELQARALARLQVRAGKLDCQEHREMCQRLAVRGYPTVRFFSGAAGEQGVDVGTQSVAEVVRALLPTRHDEL